MRNTATTVSSAEALAAFVKELVHDWEAEGVRWTNQTAGEFVEALGAWLTDMEGYYARIGTTAAAESPWRVMADAVGAARYYE